MTIPRPAEDRFWEKVEKSDGCWNWTASKTRSGYGLFWANSSVQCAHRFSYELANGEIPAGMQIDHTCHDRGCVNPDHLRTVTAQQNHQNRTGPQANNMTSGIRGVAWRKDVRKWQAIVGLNRKYHYVGLFVDLADAEAAVIAKRNELYTHNDIDRRAA